MNDRHPHLDTDKTPPYVGGSKVRVQVPTTDATVVGRVHGGDGYRRVRIIVEPDDDGIRTSMLVPRAAVVEVIER